MKRIAGMILVVAMVASLGIVSVFAADTREDEMPATCSGRNYREWRSLTM